MALGELEGITGFIGQEDINFGNGLDTDTFTVKKFDDTDLTLTRMPSFKPMQTSYIKGSFYLTTGNIADHGAQSGPDYDNWNLFRVLQYINALALNVPVPIFFLTKPTAYIVSTTIALNPKVVFIMMPGAIINVIGAASLSMMEVSSIATGPIFTSDGQAGAYSVAQSAVFSKCWFDHPELITGLNFITWQDLPNFEANKGRLLKIADDGKSIDTTNIGNGDVRGPNGGVAANEVATYGDTSGKNISRGKSLIRHNLEIHGNADEGHINFQPLLGDVPTPSNLLYDGNRFLFNNAGQIADLLSPVIKKGFTLPQDEVIAIGDINTDDGAEIKKGLMTVSGDRGIKQAGLAATTLGPALVLSNEEFRTMLRIEGNSELRFVVLKKSDQTTKIYKISMTEVTTEE